MTIRAIFRASFTQPPPVVYPVFQYGMLVVCLLLIAWNIKWLSGLPPDYPYERYGCAIVTLALLFNHLAFWFRWPASLTVALRLLALGWLAFLLFYICYCL